MAASFETQLAADAEAINQALADYFARLKFSAAPRLIEAMSYAVMAGGKRLRGALVLGAWRLASGGIAPNKEKTAGGAVQVASAFESIHAYSLIHDDLPPMDDAELRRGQPACHIRFDEATAILAGDALQSMGFALLADASVHEDAKIRADLIADLAHASGAGGMAGGQMLDLEAELRPFDLDEIRTMQALKTGALIRAAAVAGGRIAGASDDLLHALGGYADCIGLAFQIADDLLDCRGDATAMGKPAGRDHASGKASFVEVMGAQKAELEANRLIEEAKQILTDATGCSAPHLDYMIEMSSFMVNRGH